MILLIAYGNPLRQDDGAGLRLAEQMAQRWQEQSHSRCATWRCSS